MMAVKRLLGIFFGVFCFYGIMFYGFHGYHSADPDIWYVVRGAVVMGVVTVVAILLFAREILR